MELSERGTAFIASFEGYRATLYNDPAGHATIGYGHLVHLGPIDGRESEQPFKGGLSKGAALSLLHADTLRFAEAVDRLVTVPLEQHQFDALVSFAFNLGIGALEKSDLRKRLNNGEYDAVPEELMRWNMAGGRVLEGLARRRRREGLLFKTGDYEGTGNMALSDILKRRLGERFVDLRTKYSDGYGWMDSRKAPYLAVHHATGGRNVTIEAIHKHHTVTNGWPSTGYHWVIRLGVLYYVGDVDTMRAHVKGRNDEALGVCITGDYSATPPAAEDLDVLRHLVAGLDEYYAEDKKITDHRSMLPGHTTCPGDVLHDWLEQNDLRAPLVQDAFAVGAGVRAAMKARGDAPTTNEDYYPFGSLTRGKQHLYLWDRQTNRVYVAEAA